VNVKTKPITIVELRRMKTLADLGMPLGSIATLVSHEFGAERNATDVRGYLRRHYGWRSASARGGRKGVTA
jgi:hypothetical protein